ncbi:MAG: hypothetical protein ACLT40_10810 [Fusobacterium sp.]
MIKRIIYTCNHIEEIEDKIGGEKKVKSLCPECFKKKYEADSKLGIKLAKKYNYPALVGTEKQKMAGEAIRYRWITFLEYLKEAGQSGESIKNLEAILKSVISSVFYVKKGTYKQAGILKTKIEDKKKINWQVIYPINITESNCALYFYKNEDNTYFVGFEGTQDSKALETFHLLNFKWENPTWVKIYNDEEQVIDILSVLISKLLSFGYTISIPEKVKSSIREVSMEDLYKERLISEKLNLNNKISDIRGTISDIQDGQWNKEQLEKYLIKMLNRDLSKAESELEKLLENINKL